MSRLDIDKYVRSSPVFFGCHYVASMQDADYILLLVFTPSQSVLRKNLRMPAFINYSFFTDAC
jgi:hypothetical protein